MTTVHPAPPEADGGVAGLAATLADRSEHSVATGVVALGVLSLGSANGVASAVAGDAIRGRWLSTAPESSDAMLRFRPTSGQPEKVYILYTFIRIGEKS
jgi:hypothetical protein